ncbi:MAG: tetratricopeptide repeat protein [Chloroflexota bacterium]
MAKVTGNFEQEPLFRQALKDALNNFRDVGWLGNHSPLATPYLLGNQLLARTVESNAIGRALQQVLSNAAQKMKDNQEALHYRIIEQRFFQGQSVEITRGHPEISLSRSRFYDHLNLAIERLDQLLLAELNPAIRLEAPVTIDVTKLLERQKQSADCQQRLRMNQTVMLTGSGGMGKTALGSFLAQEWGEENTLWFTIRPGINDHINSFVFVLAYFCHQQGSSSLWQELIVRPGEMPHTRYAEMIRYTLEQLTVQPLICVDEADLLLPASEGRHAQFIELLNLMRGQVPILLMGQKVFVEADYYEGLTELSPTACNVLLKEARIQVDESARHRVYTYTAGNPRLLQLLITLMSLYKEGEPISALLAKLPRVPSNDFLLVRILRRLEEIEVALLKELSVFQLPAPADVWTRHPKSGFALSRLIDNRLVQQDAKGAVFLLPVYRDMIAALISSDHHEQLHMKAATIFAERAQYTSAAFHLSQTQEPERAVWSWSDVQQAEINQGQAHAALTLFQSMKSLFLSEESKEKVTLYCARLESLLGNPAKAQADLGALIYRTPILAIEAEELGGVIANDRGEFGTAEELFRRAISKAEEMVELRLAHSYKGLGWRHYRERELSNAWREVSFARYEVENFEGLIRYAERDYVSAIECYQQAYQIALSLNHHDGIAKTCGNLAKIYSMTGDFEKALTYHNQARETYRRIGKTIAIDGMENNYAFLLNLSGQHAEAEEVLLGIVEKKKNSTGEPTPFLTALIYQGLAEACLGQRKLEEATEYVSYALDQEETAIQPDSLRTRGEILMEQGEFDLAEQQIRESIALIEQNEDPDLYLAGYAWRALATLYIRKNEEPLARKAKKRAIESFERINLANEVERTVKALSNAPPMGL